MMKFLYLIIFIVFYSCTTLKNDQSSKVVRDYYVGLNQSDFSMVSSCIADTFFDIAGDFQMKYSKTQYYDWFQWDSVFKPEYKVLKIKIENDSLIATISKYCKRINFLIGEPLIYDMLFQLKDNKIESKYYLTSYNTDWNKWNVNRDRLLNWTKINFPEYSAFMDKQNREYGERYLKAIELYKNH